MKRRLMLAGGVEVDQACRYCTAFMAMSPDSTGQERGECHLRAPVAHMDTRAGVFPRISPHNWCMEFEPSPE